MRKSSSPLATRDSGLDASCLARWMAASTPAESRVIADTYVWARAMLSSLPACATPGTSARTKAATGVARIARERDSRARGFGGKAPITNKPRFTVAPLAAGPVEAGPSGLHLLLPLDLRAVLERRRACRRTRTTSPVTESGLALDCGERVARLHLELVAAEVREDAVAVALEREERR